MRIMRSSVQSHACTLNPWQGLSAQSHASTLHLFIHARVRARIICIANHWSNTVQANFQRQCSVPDLLENFGQYSHENGSNAAFFEVWCAKVDDALDLDSDDERKMMNSTQAKEKEAKAAAEAAKKKTKKKKKAQQHSTAKAEVRWK